MGTPIMGSPTPMGHPKRELKWKAPKVGTPTPIEIVKGNRNGDPNNGDPEPNGGSKKGTEMRNPNGDTNLNGGS